MTTSIILIWVLGSALVGLIGRNRTIGFLPVFIISLVVSPAIGAIVALCSKYKNSLARIVENQELQMRQSHAQFNTARTQPGQSHVLSKADELLKLKQLLDHEVISQEEFTSEKARILNDK
jgi:hypothetical protein